MAAIRTGDASLETRKGGTLHMRRPFYLTALENGDFGEDHIHDAERFAKALLAARQLWAEVNRNGRRYSEKPYDGPKNRLARRRQGGGQ